MSRRASRNVRLKVTGSHPFILKRHSALALIIALASCTVRPPSPMPSENPAPSVSLPQKTESGLASYYSSALHGKMTASGEIYNEALFTAAHRTLPFHTTVRVVNPANGRTVIVRVNDRGPFLPKRVIDLSFAAAREIEMIIHGVVPVQLEVIEAPVTEPKQRAQRITKGGSL